MPTVVLSQSPPHRLWTVAQLLGVGLTVILILGLVRWPIPTLHLLWDMVIPVLPAVFLVNPMLWRNVCPLGTLNDWTGRRGQAPLSLGLLVGAWIVGVVLLSTLVPARRFLFNQDGLALAVTIVVVGVLALVVGFRSPRRAGFCNSLCPVLPVEKLYGQAPLVKVASARCRTCDLCTRAGCIDLVGGKGARQSLRRRGQQWLLSPFGIFAAAFPGFIIGYFTRENGTIATAGSVYLHVGTWALGSLLLVTLLMHLVRPQVAVALPLLGGLSAGLYYWYAAPGLATAYGIGTSGAAVVRALAAVLLAVWLWNAFRTRQQEPAFPAVTG